MIYDSGQVSLEHLLLSRNISRPFTDTLRRFLRHFCFAPLAPFPTPHTPQVEPGELLALLNLLGSLTLHPSRLCLPAGAALATLAAPLVKHASVFILYNY